MAKYSDEQYRRIGFALAEGMTKLESVRAGVPDGKNLEKYAYRVCKSPKVLEFKEIREKELRAEREAAERIPRYATDLMEEVRLRYA